jgi:mannose-6-phosphate isomerase-like protein (cupin superfamily)
MLQIKNNPKNGSGFDTLHQFGGWKVAFVTYAEQYGELKAVKRHLLTDETFVLINGSATLYTADGDKPLVKTELEKEKLYVVEKGTWHHLQVSENALLVVVENSDTTKENTQTKIVD